MPADFACKIRKNMRRSCVGGKPRLRRGVATLDYVLILGVVLPMAAFILHVGPRIMRLAYDMVCALVSWPFM